MISRHQITARLSWWILMKIAPARSDPFASLLLHDAQMSCCHSIDCRHLNCCSLRPAPAPWSGQMNRFLIMVESCSNLVRLNYSSGSLLVHLWTGSRTWIIFYCLNRMTGMAGGWVSGRTLVRQMIARFADPLIWLSLICCLFFFFCCYHSTYRTWPF